MEFTIERLSWYLSGKVNSPDEKRPQWVGIYDSVECKLKEIEESDLVFFACSAYPPDSQSTPN
jgi:hypothetical protein